MLRGSGPFRSVADPRNGRIKTHRCTLEQDWGLGLCDERAGYMGGDIRVAEGPKGYGQDDETEDGDAQACPGAGSSG